MSNFRKSRWLLALVAPFWLSVSAFGQLKIGVVDVQGAMTQTAELKKAQTDVAAKYKTRQDELIKLQKDLALITQQLNLGDKLTPQAQSDLSAQSARKQRDITRVQEDLQADVDRDRNEILAQCSDRMDKVVTKLAEDKGLDAVFASGAAVYFKPVLDLTKEAVAAYDKAYPVK